MIVITFIIMLSFPVDNTGEELDVNEVNTKIIKVDK